MFYLGVISGFLALVFPTEAMGKAVLTWDMWRFYFCHIIIIAVPLLMVLLKNHKLDFTRIWKMPFYALAFMLFIICNQVLQSELGIIDLRGDDLLDINYKNSSFIWGPTDPLAVLFTIFTPEFMTTVPYGDLAGSAKYWPFFYMVPGAFVYFWILPIIMCLPWEHKHIKTSLISFGQKIKRTFTRKKFQPTNQKNNDEKQLKGCFFLCRK